jgi:hypothetical protein
MFWASSHPSLAATTVAVAASGLPLERGGSSAVGHARTGRPAGHIVHFGVFYFKN